MDNVPEEWREVEEFPGYEVSDLGRVRSWKQYRHHRRKRPLILKTFLSGGVGNASYPTLKLARHGEKHSQRVHQLVARAFLGPCPDGQVVCHNNGDSTDNRASNLRYATMASNYADRKRHGTHLIGEQHPMARLTKEQVLEIRRLQDHVSQTEIMERFGINRKTVWNIQAGRLWKHLL